jgi:hypothetical protein
MNIRASAIRKAYVKFCSIVEKIIYLMPGSPGSMLASFNTDQPRRSTLKINNVIKMYQNLMPIYETVPACPFLFLEAEG